MTVMTSSMVVIISCHGPTGSGRRGLGQTRGDKVSITRLSSSPRAPCRRLSIALVCAPIRRKLFEKQEKPAHSYHLIATVTRAEHRTSDSPERVRCAPSSISGRQLIPSSFRVPRERACSSCPRSAGCCAARKWRAINGSVSKRSPGRFLRQTSRARPDPAVC